MVLSNKKDSGSVVEWKGKSFEVITLQVSLLRNAESLHAVSVQWPNSSVEVETLPVAELTD